MAVATVYFVLLDCVRTAGVERVREVVFIEVRNAASRPFSKVVEVQPVTTFSLTRPHSHTPLLQAGVTVGEESESDDDASAPQPTTMTTAAAAKAQMVTAGEEDESDDDAPSASVLSTATTRASARKDQQGARSEWDP